MNENGFDLNVAQTAAVAGCHRNTVLLYERRGLIQSARNRNNFRRFPLSEALKLKNLLESRTPGVQPDSQTESPTDIHARN